MAEKTVCFRIEEETIDSFKKYCIDNKKTMKQLLKELILKEMGELEEVEVE